MAKETILAVRMDVDMRMRLEQQAAANSLTPSVVVRLLVQAYNDGKLTINQPEVR